MTLLIGTYIPPPPPLKFLERQENIELRPLFRWVFEKYDGVRAFWNPEKKAFYSRYGKQFQLPEDVVASMPKDIFLDGELWYSEPYPMPSLTYDRFGRDAFEESLKISGRANPAAINWSRFKYMVFDIPTHSGTYKERYDALGIFSYPHRLLQSESLTFI